jgi:hypothetical protein
MKALFRSLGTCVLLGAFVPHSAVAQAPAAPQAQRDGQRDLDFNLGSWRARIQILHTSLTGPGTWVELNGTAVVRNVWGGRAQLEEIEADGSTGHLEALVLLLYDPQSHQWSKSFANSTDGQLGQAMIGEFSNGHGEFLDQESFHGRIALMRADWSDITANSQHFQESFSYDEGKTWQPYFIATFTRQGR